MKGGRLQVSRNTRSQDKLEDVLLFLDRTEQSTSQKHIVCSSVEHSMGRRHKVIGFPMFSQRMRADGATVEEWPERTEVHCFYDGEPFDTVPITVPHCEDGGTYGVRDVVCSGNCGVSWIVSNFAYNKQSVLQRFNKMLVEVFRLPPIDVFNMKMAPPLRALRKFGGPYTIEQFREKSLVANVVLVEPPFITRAMFFQEQQRNRNGEGAGAGASAGANTNADPAAFDGDHQQREHVGGDMQHNSHRISNLRRPRSVSRTARSDNNNTLVHMAQTSGAAEVETNAGVEVGAGANASASAKDSGHTGVCNGLQEGGLYRKFVSEKNMGGDEASTLAPKPQTKTAARGKSRKRNASTGSRIAEARASGVQGTLAQFIRTTK
jgi:hypothetical protein